MTSLFFYFSIQLASAYTCSSSITHFGFSTFPKWPPKSITASDPGPTATAAQYQQQQQQQQQLPVLRKLLPAAEAGPGRDSRVNSSSSVMRAGETEHVCAVCLDSYEEGELVKALPCEHRWVNAPCMPNLVPTTLPGPLLPLSCRTLACLPVVYTPV